MMWGSDGQPLTDLYILSQIVSDSIGYVRFNTFKVLD
jgi:hypothetical protein